VLTIDVELGTHRVKNGMRLEGRDCGCGVALDGAGRFIVRSTM
jgi:hypothetical protein